MEWTGHLAEQDRRGGCLPYIILFQEPSTPPSLWEALLDPQNLIAGISALAAIASTIIALLALWPDWRQRRINRMLAQSFGADFYSPEVLERSTRYYVPPNCTSVDPSVESEMKNLVVTEEKLFDVLDRFLGKESKHRHLLLLADSGMGKSSCLLNYYVRNQGLPESKRKRIAVVPLGIPEADAHIQAVDKKGETVLFLDAFDEDTKAIQDHRERLRYLMEIAAPFRRIVITCRTQFFLQDEEIPRETGVVRIEPRRAGERGVYEFQKLYLSPLNDEQVERFLKKRYPIWRVRNRRKARRLVQSVPLLTVRPMLLAYIPDLLETDAPVQHGFELYEALIDSWLERESRWVDKRVLRQFSEQLALDLYQKREVRGTERIPVHELVRLANYSGIPLEIWQLTGRSLLNRDAAGNYKFAHRSIMEYLVVMRFMDGDSAAKELEWTDQMAKFLEEIVISSKARKLSPRVLLADCLNKIGYLPSSFSFYVLQIARDKDGYYCRLKIMPSRVAKLHYNLSAQIRLFSVGGVPSFFLGEVDMNVDFPVRELPIKDLSLRLKQESGVLAYSSKVRYEMLGTIRANFMDRKVVNSVSAQGESYVDI